jgi:predicted metal-binding protein
MLLICGQADTNASKNHTASIFRAHVQGRRYFLADNSPEDGDSMFLRNACIYLQVQTALLPRKSIAVKIEAERSSETLVSTYKSKQRYLLEKHSSEDGDSMFLRNACIYLQVQTALLPRKSTAVKMEAACSSETLVSTYKAKQCYFLEKHSPEDGGSTFLRNAGIYLQVQTALLPTKVHL